MYARPASPRLPAPATSKQSGHVLKFFAGRLVRGWLPFVLLAVVSLWLLASFHFPPPPPPWENYPFQRVGLPNPPSNDSLWAGRAQQVRNAFVHAYSGYKKVAFPSDELLPLTAGKVDNFNGWAVSLMDSLDTMWIMGLDDLFYDGVQFASNLDFAKKDVWVPFFETVIRYLGGLLSAYALSGEPALLFRADQLGQQLLPAMKTRSGFPMFAVNAKTGVTRPGWAGYGIFAEMTSCQMEFKYLAHITGKQEYYFKAEAIMDKIEGFVTMWDVDTAEPRNHHFSVGASADSGYEYFLKQWLLSGQSEPKTRDLCDLLYLTPTRNLLYHLSCFLPGLLALGVHTLDLSPEDEERHRWAAHGLAYSCYIGYADQLSGLGGDVMQMKHNWKADGRPSSIPPGVKEVEPEQRDFYRDYSLASNVYLLRPETVESIFILWKTTGDVKWRKRGWAIFEAIEKHAKTELGYASVTDVRLGNTTLINEMPR
ncbi:glycoside hydrolase [Mycena floridula]|nr:glycoside hydrolase [Mycena floridula]